MDAYALIDPLNFKGLISLTTDFIKENVPNSNLRNTLRFLQYLLDFEDDTLAGFEKTRNAVAAFQKLFSGNLPPQKLEPMTRQILSGELDVRLKENLGMILSQIRGTADYSYFFRDCTEKAFGPYFPQETVCQLEALRQQDTDEALTDFLLILVRHGLQDLGALPCFAARRIYAEAQTYDFDQPLRFHLLRIAADYGNRDAALEYGNYVNRTRPSGIVPEQDARIAFTYTLKALPLPAAIWNLAYQLESLQLSEDQIQELTAALKIENRLSEVRDYLPELQQVYCDVADSAKRNAYILAYKINFYLGYFGFTKGFHSLAKFLSRREYGFLLRDDPDQEKRRSLAEHYAEKALAGGNIPAMQVAALEILKKAGPALHNATPLELCQAERLLITCAGAGMKQSLLTLGEFYEKRGGSQDLQSARICFQKLLDTPFRGKAYYALGRISPTSEQNRCFEQAVEAGCADAAYDYALSMFRLYESTGDSLLLHKAIQVLSRAMLRLAPDLRPQAEALVRDLTAHLKL